jgi:dihydroorotase
MAKKLLIKITNGQSAFENYTFNSKIMNTLVNGQIVFDNGTFNEQIKGKRLRFEKYR